VYKEAGPGLYRPGPLMLLGLQLDHVAHPVERGHVPVRLVVGATDLAPVDHPPAGEAGEHEHLPRVGPEVLDRLGDQDEGVAVAVRAEAVDRGALVHDLVQEGGLAAARLGHVGLLEVRTALGEVVLDLGQDGLVRLDHDAILVGVRVPEGAARLGEAVGEAVLVLVVLLQDVRLRDRREDGVERALARLLELGLGGAVEGRVAHGLGLLAADVPPALAGLRVLAAVVLPDLRLAVGGLREDAGGLELQALGEGAEDVLLLGVEQVVDVDGRARTERTGHGKNPFSYLSSWLISQGRTKFPETGER